MRRVQGVREAWSLGRRDQCVRHDLGSARGGYGAAFFDNPREAERAIRKAISAMHPDKNHEIRTQATTLLCIFNYLLEEVRKIKNVASVEGYS